MNKSNFFLFCLFLVLSLKLSAQVHNGGWDNTYMTLLSEADKSKLNDGREITLKFNSNSPEFIANGLVRILPTSEKGKYNYIEIGEWNKEYDFKRSNSDKGHAKVEMVFDSLGNIVRSKVFEKQYDQNQYLIREESNLFKEVINGKLVYFHLVKSYYETGELWIEAYQRLLDFDKSLSHFDKKSVPAKFKKEYEKSGKLKKEKKYSITGV